MADSPVSNATVAPEGVEVRGAFNEGYAEILTTEALAFIAELQRRFGPTREALLERRQEIQAKIDDGWMPGFLDETKAIRDADWVIAPIPSDLKDRRVEITGPLDRKMVINALNCGAKVFMADFEDATTPTWINLIEGHINLRDAIRRDITFDDAKSGKHYQLNDEIATLLVRPRGWHLPEVHILVDGNPMSGSLCDFGLYLFNNHAALKDRGTGPYFYLPKLENHLEARLWNDVFSYAEQELGITPGTIKGTVLIETILAAFEMDEILYELRDHMGGLNCGRWDYIFSFIKKFSNRPDFVLPDRDQVSMVRDFLRAYTQLTIKTCHRRNAHAIGGMAAQIPNRHDADANAEALSKVRTDKEREATDGHDGTWVAHPGLVPIALEQFDTHMKESNQIARKRQDVNVSAADLLQVPDGTITEKGLRHNISVGIQYIESWLGGTGCVPLYNLMEDAATAEICRAQVWQWLKHGASISDGPKINTDLVDRLLGEQLEQIKVEVGEERYAKGHYDDASELFEQLIKQEQFNEFLTLPAYERVTASV